MHQASPHKTPQKGAAFTKKKAKPFLERSDDGGQPFRAARRCNSPEGLPSIGQWQP
jgi:hypothetical protein